MRYFLIAGEASGDLHAAPLIEALRALDPEAEFAFLGGDLMAAAAGSRPVIHYRDMAFMGFGQVIRHLGKIRANFKAARRAIKEFSPDCLILIDYPTFNLKMARFAKEKMRSPEHPGGIPVVYYISPKVWAWKQWRVKTIKRLVDLMLVIFPFEVDFYRRHGYEVTYVGNPSVEEIDKHKAQSALREVQAPADTRPLVALLPGSRLGEIAKNLPVMVQAMKLVPGCRAVVAGAPGVDPGFYSRFTELPVVHGDTYSLLSRACAALVTSGTATLETALLGVPQVAVYRANGSKLTYRLMKGLLKVSHVTLPNLIADGEIIPEMLLHLCTPEAVAERLRQILPGAPGRQAQLDGYARMRSLLTDGCAPRLGAQAIRQALTRPCR